MNITGMLLLIIIQRTLRVISQVIH